MTVPAVMGNTSFPSQLSAEKIVWARESWRTVRQQSLFMKYTGTGTNAVFQRITELTPSEKGDKAIITLVHDLVGDGIPGDNTLEGNEEKLSAADIEIKIDQLRHAVKNTGRMDDQRSIIDFRSTAKDRLGYWMARVVDEMAFQTLSGISYALRPDGSPRSTNSLTQLGFAGAVSAPTADRHFRWDSAGNQLQQGNTTAMTTADKITWRSLVALRAEIVSKFIRPVRGDSGTEVFYLFMHPLVLGQLKLDPDFIANLRQAGPRDMNNNPLFKTGTEVWVDNMLIVTTRHMFNTRGAATGSKWGAAGAVDGSRVMMVGAQALGYAELGAPDWDENDTDFKNVQRIKLGQIVGFVKPVFPDADTRVPEDFGAVALDVAI